MNLLKEGIESGAVIKTSMSKKLALGGDYPYPIFKVRLDWLFYNDQNDRIATWISKYKSEHDGQVPDHADKEIYNKIIEQFIVESNPEAIRKTQANIEMIDQREPGVVLADGRIIDGNRRFTCLRRLAEKSDRFGFFETVILSQDLNNNAKDIKLLELSLQHGVESRVDYNPIDRLVGVYNDIIATKLISEEEYARNTNESISDVKRRVEIAKLMVDFLEFCNAPKQFHIARDLQIYYPLEELLKLLKKCHSEDEAEDLKISVFTNILMQPAGDMTRYIRNIKSIIGSESQDEFISEQRELSEQVLDILPPIGKVNTAAIREIRSQEEMKRALEGSTEKALMKVRRNETRNRPVQLVEKATTFLEGIDTNILLKMNDSELQRLMRQLKKLEQVISDIRKNL